MQNIHAKIVASITELKKNPSKLIHDANGQAIAILNHNTAAAYLIPSDTYERLLELLDDQAIIDIVRERLSDKSKPIRIDLDEL
jgi:antitoxin StbD